LCVPCRSRRATFARACCASVASAACFLLFSLFAERTTRAAETPDDRDKALPCRPTIACTADVVPPGTLDAETGVIFRHLGAPGGVTTDTGATRTTGATRQWSFPFLLKLTVAPWLQLQAGSSGFTAARGDAPESFFDDAVVGAKFHLHDQTRLTPSIALSADASIPTFSGLGYERTVDAFFTAYVTKDVGYVHADFNAVLNVWRLDAAPRKQGLVALALTANVPPPFGVMGEAYYQSSADPLASRDGGFLFAFTHSPRPWLIFDMGGDVGFFPSYRSYSTFIGMSFIPAVLWRSGAEAAADGMDRQDAKAAEKTAAGAPWKERPLPASASIR
jgi:hypothetical protein